MFLLTIHKSPKNSNNSEIERQLLFKKELDAEKYWRKIINSSLKYADHKLWYTCTIKELEVIEETN
tara:strand:+ start:502 stop:699 length:198 start_codon:yes stop_codon:yes gene_type:complete